MGPRMGPRAADTVGIQAMRGEHEETGSQWRSRLYADQEGVCALALQAFRPTLLTSLDNSDMLPANGRLRTVGVTAGSSSAHAELGS